MWKRSACFSLFFLAACAGPLSTLPVVDPDLAEAEARKQRDLAFELFLANNARARRVAYPILTANTALCEDNVARLVGFTASTRIGVPKDFRLSAASLLGVDDRVTVISVTPGSAAARSGLVVGDKILAIDDWVVPTSRRAAKQFDEQIRNKLAAGPVITLDVSRGGQSYPFAINPDDGCSFPVSVTTEQSVNAFADGKSIRVTSGMMRFAISDDELATVIGHELAHNTMGHISKQTTNANVGLLFDVLAAGLGVNTLGAFSNYGADAFSRDFEAEADYVGLYLMARAGYDIGSAPHYWRRMGATNPGAIALEHTTTHPATPERFVALELTVAEIDGKRLAGLALLPGRVGDAQVASPPVLETIAPAGRRSAPAPD